MPRGIPNAKRDENAMRFTSFHVPLAPNPKQMGSMYLKSDSQTMWARHAARASTKGKTVAEDLIAAVPEARRGSKVIVIHPGSRFLRVGRASDVTPVTVPSVIARKEKPPVPEPKYIPGISRPQEGRERGEPSTSAQSGDEYAVTLASDDPFDTKVAAITVSLRDRMRFYKLRVAVNAASVACPFNEQFKPEIIPEVNDPYQIEWITSSDEEYLVGDKALRLSDLAQLGYVMRWPFHGGSFNTKAYDSNQLILSDVEAILEATLKERLNIEPKSFKDYSVVLVIPDFYERAYVEALVRILLVSMGFKQLCAQQESLAATYGAGISNACVVDMGATVTTIACVDDGLVLSDTRMTLNMGGDDITEFLYVLLEKINFPYRDINLSRSYDWNVMEDLKARLCTLAEGDVALNLYDFVVRRPGRRTEKYGLRAYDEIILAPMSFFEPRVIEFEGKRAGMRPFQRLDVSDEIVEQPSDHISQAMLISTQHLLPSAIPALVSLPEPSASTLPSAPQTPGINGAAQPNAPLLETAVSNASSVNGTDSAVQEGETPNQPKKEESTPVPPHLGPTVSGEGTADAPMEIVDDESEKPLSAVVPSQTPQTQKTPVQPIHVYPGGYAIDVAFEASKLPLDVAIFNSARAAGGDEKIRKYLQAVLVIGGTALVPGMAHALESRLQAIATPLVPNMEKVQIIPPPKDVDPRVLAWKGAAVLGKMDGVSDLWITAADWDVLGMRGLKERCFFL
ncbi:actin family protein [Abortiporus biennis]